MLEIIINCCQVLCLMSVIRYIIFILKKKLSLDHLIFFHPKQRNNYFDPESLFYIKFVTDKNIVFINPVNTNYLRLSSLDFAHLSFSCKHVFEAFLWRSSCCFTYEMMQKMIFHPVAGNLKLSMMDFVIFIFSYFLSSKT